MCIEKTCGGGSDYCCSNDCLDSDGPRSCGMFIMLHMDIFLLINWSINGQIDKYFFLNVCIICQVVVSTCKSKESNSAQMDLK